MAVEHEMQEFFKQAGAVVSAAYNAAMRGGEIQAAVRQGFNELGTAFGKAFPDSIQVDEPGAAFNPLYSDIAADKRSHIDGPDAGLPSPGEIAGGKSTLYGETQSAGKDHLPSPSEIANEQQPYKPEQDQGRDNGQEHGRGM